MKKRNKQIFIVLGVFSLFVLTRILALRIAGSFWFDEAFSVYFASKPFSQLWTFLQFEHNPLLHFFALHWWIQLFGASAFSVRFLSFLAGVVSFGFLYLLGKKLFSSSSAIWSLFFFTISPFFLYHQTEARMYAFVTLFSLLSLYTFWCFQEASKHQQKRASLFWLSSYGLSAIGLVHSHITAWTLPFAMFLFWLIERKQIQMTKEWILTNTLLLVSFLIWFIPVVQNKLSAGHISQGWFFFQSEGGLILSHLIHFLFNGESNLLLRAIGLSLIVFVLFVAYIKGDKQKWLQQLVKKEQKQSLPFSFELHWTKELQFLTLILAVSIGASLALEITVTKYLIPAGIVLLLLLGKGMASFSRPAQALLGSCLFVLALPMQLQLAFVQRHHFQEVAMHIQTITQEDPSVKLISHSFVWALPLSFYDYGEQEIYPFYPLEDTLTLEERIVRYNWQGLVNSDNVELLQEELADTNSVLLISSTPNRDERDPVKRWFYANGWRLEQVSRWEGYGNPELLYFQR